MEGVLDRARKRAGNIGTVIDIGAAAGRWTRKALSRFPDARFLLVEALEERRAQLDALRREHPAIEFVIAAAGNRTGTENLSVSSDLDGSGIYGGGDSDRATRKVALTTIDEEVRKRNLPGPFFLKFDTHGFEVPILEGASETLKQTTVLLLEMYNFQISQSCLRFPQMCAHLEGLGFRCADMADPMLRPHDDSLWQLDLLFRPSSSTCFAYKKYR
jgi:FkbM family methyltransferase